VCWLSGKFRSVVIQASAAAPRLALPGDPHSPEFWEAIRKAQGAERTCAPTTVNVVLDAYFASTQFGDLSEGTRDQYVSRAKVVRTVWGELPAADLRPHHVHQLMDKLGGTKAKANNVRVLLKAVSAWAIKGNMIQASWVEGIDPYKLKGGHKPWTPTQCAAAEEKLTGWLRRAYFLARYTGQRGSDVVRMGWTDIEDGMIHVIQEKTKVECWPPIESPLGAEMATWDKRPGPFVYRADGSTVTRQALDDAFLSAREKIPELAGTTPHGLRANRVIELRRKGMSALQIGDLIGMSIKMVEKYCRHADKKANAVATIVQFTKAGTNRKRNQKGSL
jgi:integrase